MRATFYLFIGTLITVTSFADDNHPTRQCYVTAKPHAKAKDVHSRWYDLEEGYPLLCIYENHGEAIIEWFNGNEQHGGLSHDRGYSISGTGINKQYKNPKAYKLQSITMNSCPLNPKAAKEAKKQVEEACNYLKRKDCGFVCLNDDLYFFRPHKRFKEGQDYDVPTDEPKKSKAVK